MRHVSLVVAALTLTSLNGLTAQDGGVSQLKPGKTIRMSIRGGATYEGRLLDLVKLARALIQIKGSDDKLEHCLCEAIDRREQFSRVLEAECLS